MNACSYLFDSPSNVYDTLLSTIDEAVRTHLGIRTKSMRMYGESSDQLVFVYSDQVSASELQHVIESASGLRDVDILFDAGQMYVCIPHTHSSRKLLLRRLSRYRMICLIACGWSLYYLSSLMYERMVHTPTPPISSQ